MESEGQRLEDIQKKYSFHVYDGDPEDLLQFDQNRSTAVTLSDTLYVGEDQRLMVVRDQNVLVTRDQTVSVTNKRNIDARHISEYGKETITIDAGVELVIQGPGGSIKIDSTGVTIQGVLVKIN
jgi:type VI secretion system secreted protein VgrG